MRTVQYPTALASFALRIELTSLDESNGTRFDDGLELGTLVVHLGNSAQIGLVLMDTSIRLRIARTFRCQMYDIYLHQIHGGECSGIKSIL